MFFTAHIRNPHTRNAYAPRPRRHQSHDHAIPFDGDKEHDCGQFDEMISRPSRVGVVATAFNHRAFATPRF